MTPVLTTTELAATVRLVSPAMTLSVLPACVMPAPAVTVPGPPDCTQVRLVVPMVMGASVVQVQDVSALVVPSATYTVALTYSGPVSASVALAHAPTAAT